jgi:hypothetical protein
MCASPVEFTVSIRSKSAPDQDFSAMVRDLHRQSRS